VSDTKDPRTCTSCPWFRRHRDDPASGMCFHDPPQMVASATGTAASRAESWPIVLGRDWWCSSHPLRMPRTCINCQGTGLQTRYPEVRDGELVGSGFEHCDSCHGTKVVIP
jgi:hypothetical protein